MNNKNQMAITKFWQLVYSGENAALDIDAKTGELKVVRSENKRSKVRIPDIDHLRVVVHNKGHFYHK